MRQLCAARAALPAELADSVRIKTDNVERKPDPHDAADHIDATDFTYSISIWTISGPENAVEALLKAVGVDTCKPDMRTIEEGQSEPAEDMFPEP